MFDKLRRPGRSLKEGKTKKIFSYIIFGAICLVFVFLAPMGTKLIGEGILGYVGNEPIRIRELQLIEDSIKKEYQSRLEKADDESHLKIQEEIRQRAKAEIVKLYLLVQGSQKEGFFLSDKELHSEIRSFPVFQEEGRFLYSRYLLFLKSQNLSPSHFENRIRKSKLAQSWVNLFKKAIFSNTLEKEKKSQRHRYKVKIRYAVLHSEDIEEEHLEPLVKSRDLKKINSFLKKNDMNWEETGIFSPISGFGVPIAQNQNLMEVLVHYLPQKGIIPRFIRQANKIYIVNVLSFKEENISPKEQQLENFLSYRFDKSVRLLDSWINFQRQKIKVKLSDNI